LKIKSKSTRNIFLVNVGNKWVRFPGTTKKKVVGLERGPLSLVSTTEELLDPQKLAITSPTSGGRSVGIVRSRTQTMEFFFE
jgi:hypothetical protein